MLASVYLLSALLGSLSDSVAYATSVQNTSQMISAEKVLFFANHKSQQDEFYPQLTQLPIEYFQVYGTFISNYYDPWNTILNNLQSVEGNNTSEVIQECIDFFKTIGFTESTATTIVNGLWNMALDSRVPLKIYSSTDTATIMDGSPAPASTSNSNKSNKSNKGNKNNKSNNKSNKKNKSSKNKKSNSKKKSSSKSKKSKKKPKPAGTYTEVTEQANNDGACSYVDFLTYMGSWGRTEDTQYYCMFDDGGTKKIGFSSSIRKGNSEFLSSTQDYSGLSSHTASSLAYAIVNGYLDYNAGVGDSLTVLTKDNGGAEGARKQSEQLITDSKMYIDCFGNITCEFAGNVFVVVPGCVNPYTWTTIEDDEGTAGGQRLPLTNLFMIGRQIADGKKISGSATISGYSSSGSSVDKIEVKNSKSSTQSDGNTRMSLFTRGKSPELSEGAGKFTPESFYYPLVNKLGTGMGSSAKLTATGMWRLFRYTGNISGIQDAESDLNALNPSKDVKNKFFKKINLKENTDWMGEAETPLAKAILYGKNSTIFKPAPGTIQTSHPQALSHQSYLTDVNTGVTSGIPSVVNDKTGLTNAKSLLNFVFPTWYGSQPVASLNSDKFISDMLYFDNYNLYDTTTDAPSTIKANPTGVFGAKQGSKDALNPRVSSVNSVLPVEYDEFGNSSDYGHTFFEQAKSKSKGYALSIFATYLASDKLLATKGFQASSGGSTSTDSSSSGSSSTSTGTGSFHQYSDVSDSQLKQITALCLGEQGSNKEAVMAEASLLANRTELYKTANASGLESMALGGWFAGDSKKSYNNGTVANDGGRTPTSEEISWVKQVIKDGKRTLPAYIDEHDCYTAATSPSKYAGVSGGINKITGTENGNYVAHKTVMSNDLGSTYKFYWQFKTGNSWSDPFGYTSTAEAKRSSLGEAHYDANGNAVSSDTYNGSSTSPIPSYVTANVDGQSSGTSSSSSSGSSSSSSSSSSDSSSTTGNNANGSTNTGTTWTLVDINGTWTPDVHFRFNRSGLPKAVCNSSWNWAPTNGDGTDKVLNDIKNWVWYILNPVKGLNYLRVWFKNKVSSLLVDIHFDIVGYGNGVNVGATKYVGFAGYTTTPNLKDMEWTDKILNIYDSLFVFIVVIVAIILLGYVIVGQLSIQRAIIGVLIFAICAYIPPTVINGVINFSNTISDSIYSDKFMYWALVNHESYVSELNSSYEDYANAILENSNAWFSTSVDDDNEATAGRNNGATSAIALKWMNPKTFTYQNKSNSGFGDVVQPDSETTEDGTTEGGTAEGDNGGVTANATSTSNTQGTTSSGQGKSLGIFHITYYCPCEKCCGKGATGTTASGTKATAGRTIATDPSVIPKGTQVVIEGHTYTAEDTGGAIKGKRIDIFVDDHQEALRLGTKDVEVFEATGDGTAVNGSNDNGVTSVADAMVSQVEHRVLSQEIFAENTTADYLYRNYSDIAAHSMYLYNNMLLNKDAFKENSGNGSLVSKVTSNTYDSVSSYLQEYNNSVKLDFNNSTAANNVMRFAPMYQDEDDLLSKTLDQDLSNPSYSESYGINSKSEMNFSIGEVNQNTNSGTYYEKDGLFEYILNQESPFYYFSWNFYDQGMTTTSSGTYATLLTDKIVDEDEEESEDVKTASSGYFYCNSDDSLAFGQTKDFLDMKTLFTVVIPMYKQLNDKVVAYRERYGMKTYDIEDVDEEERGSDELEFKKWHNKNVEDLWSIWCPWVAQLYEGKYAETTTVKVAGTSYTIEDPLNPASYPAKEGRPMVFSKAEQMYYGLSDRDLTEVEKRIIAVEEKSVKDMYNLLNYYSFNDTVMTTAAAMTVTFNFNREFSESNLLSSGATLYPTSFELKNFGYDAYLRMIMATATGEDLLNSDLYLTIVRDSSIFTAMFMILNDLVVVYGISFIKILFVLLIFGLSIITVIAAAIKLEINIVKVLWNSLFGPLIKFLLISIGHAYIISFFMKGGNVSVTDAGKFYISMGDPAMTLVFLTVVNVVLCILYFKLLKTGVLDFIKYIKMITASVGGMVTGIGVKVADTAGLSGRSFATGAAVGAGAVSLGVLGAKGLERGAGNKAPNATKTDPSESEATKAQAKSHKSREGDIDSVNSKISSGEAKVNGGNGVSAAPTGTTNTESLGTNGNSGGSGTATRTSARGSATVAEATITPMKGESIARDVRAHNKVEKREAPRRRVRSESEIASSRHEATSSERNDRRIRDYEGRLNNSNLDEKQSRDMKSEVNTRRGRATRQVSQGTRQSGNLNTESRKAKTNSADYSQVRRKQASGRKVGDVSPNPRR